MQDEEVIDVHRYGRLWGTLNDFNIGPIKLCKNCAKPKLLAKEVRLYWETTYPATCDDCRQFFADYYDKYEPIIFNTGAWKYVFLTDGRCFACYDGWDELHDEWHEIEPNNIYEIRKYRLALDLAESQKYLSQLKERG